jgi:hypothetical protein
VSLALSLESQLAHVSLGVRGESGKGIVGGLRFDLSFVFSDLVLQCVAGVQIDSRLIYICCI